MLVHAVIIFFQAQSDYRTLPVVGYDPNDHHHWFTMGRKHNAFNPESQSDNIDTKYAVDRMRITQVKIRYIIFKPNPNF